jgi:hypothetical protein
VENATIIYSDDGDIAKLARPRMQVLGIASLPIPPAKTQGDMFEEEQEPYSSNPDFGR